LATDDVVASTVMTCPPSRCIAAWNEQLVRVDGS
jgi:hypothetical protein